MNQVALTMEKAVMVKTNYRLPGLGKAARGILPSELSGVESSNREKMSLRKLQNLITLRVQLFSIDWFADYEKTG